MDKELTILSLLHCMQILKLTEQIGLTDLLCLQEEQRQNIWFDGLNSNSNHMHNCMIRIQRTQNRWYNILK